VRPERGELVRGERGGRRRAASGGAGLRLTGGGVPPVLLATPFLFLRPRYPLCAFPSRSLLQIAATSSHWPAPLKSNEGNPDSSSIRGIAALAFGTSRGKVVLVVETAAAVAWQRGRPDSWYFVQLVILVEYSRPERGGKLCWLRYLRC
jgi:hypothetical protein